MYKALREKCVRQQREARKAVARSLITEVGWRRLNVVATP